MCTASHRSSSLHLDSCPGQWPKNISPALRFLGENYFCKWKQNLSKMIKTKVKQRLFSCTILAVSTANKDTVMWGFVQQCLQWHFPIFWVSSGNCGHSSSSLIPACWWLNCSYWSVLVDSELQQQPQVQAALKGIRPILSGSHPSRNSLESTPYIFTQFYKHLVLCLKHTLFLFPELNPEMHCLIYHCVCVTDTKFSWTGP